MITLSNGHKFEYMTASGAMAFDGQGWFWEQPLKVLGLFDTRLFTIVLKTITLLPKRGNLRWYNSHKCIRLIRDEKGKIVGVANKVGLTNNGFFWWRKNIGPRLNSKRNPVIVSLFGSHDEIILMVQKIEKDKKEGILSIVGIEINASCPNVREEVTSYSLDTIKACEKIGKYTDMPIILKVSTVHEEFLINGTEKYVQAYAVNSVPWSVIFPEKINPFGNGGGVSGQIVQAQTWTYMRNLICWTKRPIIASSIWKYEDIEKVYDYGAGAISFGSVFIPFPWRPTLFVKMDIKRGKNENKPCKRF